MNEILYKKKLLSTFEEYISICKRYNLRYYAAYGTVIGAVRHNGLIPWDDDIDVMMPRGDYERFISICESSDIGEYEIVTPRNCDNYYLSFSKFCDRNSTIVERKKAKCVFGVFVDIFPLDGVPENLDVYANLIKKFLKLRKELSWVSNKEGLKDFLYFMCTFQFKRFYKSLIYLFMRDRCRNAILDEMDSICMHTSFSASEKCVVFDGGIEGIFPKAWLDTPISLPFETFTVEVPNKYDEYLTQLYGDYMTPPSEREQVNNHVKAMYFLDITKRVDKKEIWK